jgi:hypothetical protein
MTSNVYINNRSNINVDTKENIFIYFGFIFFFLMLVVPTTYQLERGVLLSLVCMGAFMKASIGNFKIDKEIKLILYLTISSSLVFILIGVINNNPGALRVSTVYVVWPLLYVFFAGFFQNPILVVRFENVIIAGTIVSSIMGLLLVMDVFFGLGLQIRSLFSFQGANIGVYSGFIEYNLYNMSTLLYGFPFLFTLILVSKKNEFFKKQYIWMWIAIVLIVFVALISGRRAFWLVILLTPFINIALLYFLKYKNQLKKLVAFVCLMIIIANIAIFVLPNINFSDIKEEFLSAFDFSGEISAHLRYLQFKVLINGWMEKPFLGHGLGAVAGGIIRSHDMPWAFELSYIALLFHTGIVGFCIYASAVVWIFWSGIAIVRKIPQAAPVILPLLSGLAGFLIVNATNPYLGKFDYLWTLFLPVAAINAYRTDARFSTSLSSTGIPETNSQTV